MNVPFSGDRNMEAVLQQLVRRYGLRRAIETGTGSGLTTTSLAKLFESVQTIELNSEVFLAGKYLSRLYNVQRICGSSVKVLPQLLKQPAEPTLFYLDAVGFGPSPLIKELNAIANGSTVLPVIIIPGVHMPGSQQLPRLEAGNPLKIETISGQLAQIYGGHEKYWYSFNREPDAAAQGMLWVAPRVPAEISPRRYTLLTTFSERSKSRFNEYLSCLTTNLQQKSVERIVLFYEGTQTLPIDSCALDVIPTRNRPYFQTLFDYAKINLFGQRCIVANADIAFDQSLEKLDSVDLHTTFLAINRWEEHQDGTLRFIDNPGSQDTWIFQAPVPISAAHFYLGHGGCDKFLAYLAGAAGFSVVNPAKHIITRHRHQSQERDSDSLNSMCRTGRATAVYTDYKLSCL